MATAIYDWIVETMYRDPEVKGCGLGEVKALLKKPGGEVRGHPLRVRDARPGRRGPRPGGLRNPPAKREGRRYDEGAALLGGAEFHMPGYGWVVVDPADARKAILEKKISLETAKPHRDYCFGAVDENRIAFGTGRDIRLNPPQKGEPSTYFIYPYAEADGKPLNEDLYGINIGDTIRFREL